MNTLLLVSNVVSWALLLTLGFLVLGTLRALGVLTWRVDQLGMVQPSRIGRDGLKIGKPAPDYRACRDRVRHQKRQIGSGELDPAGHARRATGLDGAEAARGS